MKKRTAAFFLSLYGLQAAFWYPITGHVYGGPDWLQNAVLLTLVLAALALGISVLAGAVVLVKKGGPQGQAALRRLALVVKLISVPFFVINLAIWLLVTAAFLVVPGLQLLLPTVLLGVGFAYFVVVVTSAPSLAGLFLAVREGRVTLARAVVHAVVLLIFIVDVPDAVLVYRLLGRPHSRSKAVGSQSAR